MSDTTDRDAARARLLGMTPDEHLSAAANFHAAANEQTSRDDGDSLHLRAQTQLLWSIAKDTHESAHNS